MARWGEATSDHTEPERDENTRDRTVTSLFAGYEDRLAAHVAAEERAVEPEPEEDIGEEYEEEARRMVADWFGTAERTPERDHAEDVRGGEQVQEERAAELASEPDVGEEHEEEARRMVANWLGTEERTSERATTGTPLFAGYDDRLAGHVAAAEARAAEPEPEPDVGEEHEEEARRMVAKWFGTGERTPGHEAGTHHAGDVSRGAARSDERATERAGDRDPDEQPASPAGPALDPRSVWRGLTQQERYEAERARRKERGPLSRGARAEEGDHAHAGSDARLADDVARAREAERLAKEKRKQETEEELDYILRQAQGRLRPGERPPPRLEEEEYRRHQRQVQQQRQQQRQQQNNDRGMQM